MKGKDIFEWVICILVALLIVTVIKTFVGFPTVVSGPSMDSTLLDKQRLWVSKIAIEINKYPNYGDIITFEAPSESYLTKAVADTDNPVAVYNEEKEGLFSKFLSSMSLTNKESYIKRVIGLPNDHIEIKNGGVYRNGELLEEDYLDPGTITTDADGCFTDIIVPDGYVYVLGDHRSVSGDSRRFGCIPIDKIEGKAVFRFWPLNKIGLLNKNN